MTTKTPAQNAAVPVRSEAVYWILAAQALVIVPLLWQLPRWLWGLWGLTLFWRYASEKTWVNRTAGIIKWLLAGGALVGWYFTFPHRSNTEAMVGLLVMSFILKTIECHSHKDGLLLIFIGFIAVAAQFLFNQSLLTGLYGGLCLVALLLAWQSLYFGRTRPLGARFRYAGVLVLQALPLLLLLFVVMPRLSPLWKVPIPEGRGKTGFSDTLSPGDLGQLVKNGDTAFRVSFNAERPRPRDLYWRGLVLTQFDGRTWHRTPDDLSLFEEAPKSFEQLIDYSIVVEPHNQTWLFALAKPVRVDGTGIHVKLHAQSLIQADGTVFQRTQYKVVSARSLTYPEDAQLSREELNLNLTLPSNGNPQARALASMWKKAGFDTHQIIDAALGLIQREFSYTLAPPVLGNDVIDEFLFLTKRGFCEHFASSFTFLMRAAGVPARIVVGYQGGKYNDPDPYLIVSQSDAHAWVEVWQQGLGWVMIDPTAAVAPNRIELGLDQALTADERDMVGQGVISGTSWWLPVIKKWDSANFAWQRWVLNYDTEKQKNILERWFGGSDWQSVIKGLCLIGLVFAMGFALWLYGLRAKTALSFDAELVRPLYSKLNKQGFKPASDESIMVFLNRVGEQRTDYKIPAKYLAQLFERVIYGGDKHALKQLQRAIRQFPRVKRAQTRSD